MRNKLLLLLFLFWATTRVEPEKVATILRDMYSKLDPNAPYEEKKKFYAIAQIDESSLCPEGQFKDRVFKEWGMKFYCFLIPQFPDFKNRPIVPATNEKSELELCNSHFRCSLRLNDVRVSCHTMTGYKFSRYYEPMDGICIKSEAVAYLYTEIYYNLPANTPIDEKKKYLPIYSGGKKCSKLLKCDEGQFCGTVDVFPLESRELGFKTCYNKPKLPDSNNEGPIIIASALIEFNLPVCNKNAECICELTECSNDYVKCFLKTGLNLVGGDKEPILYDGICIKANPIALVFSDIYFNLDDDVTYEERKKYYPVDYMGLNQELTLKKCSMNKDCADGHFCGAAYDYQNDTSKRVGPGYEVLILYCFAIPHFSDLNNIPRVVPIVPDKSDMEICDSSLRCKEDEFWRCDMGTGMKFGKEEPKHKKKVYDGICVKEHPVAFVFSEHYKTISNDVDFEERKKYFPVDYEGFSQSTLLKTCSINRDCGDGQFCGAVYDSTDNAPKQNVYHCFAVPTVNAPFHESTKITIQPDKSGLMLCNEPTDCESELFCNVKTGQKYVKSTEGVNENVEYSGICMKADICQVNEHNEQFKWSYGTSPSNSKISCDSDEDCAGTRDTADSIFQSYCVLNKAYNNVNLCCHRETQPCKMGKLVGAGVRCGKNEGFKDGIFAECNGGLEKIGRQGEKADKWCDEGNNQCCQDQTNDKIQYCPDGQTPLFNEPKCRDYDENVVDSGECFNKTGSVCKKGHCCPDVRIDAEGKLGRNKHSYLTNHPCVPGFRPPQFLAGYCEPESGKVVIFGELSPLNETMTRWPEESPKTCQKDSDCSSDNSTLCIYNDEGYCYYNPMKHVPIQSSNVIIIIVIVIGIITLIAAIAGVTVWMFKRKKKEVMKPVGNSELQSVQSSKGLESKVSATKLETLKSVK